MANRGGQVRVEEFKKDGDSRLLAREPIALTKGTEYTLKVEDEGDTIRVTVDGKGLLAVPVQEGKGLVALYNREPVAGVAKESVVTELRVERKK